MKGASMIEDTETRQRACVDKVQYARKDARRIAREYRDGKRWCSGGWCITAYRCRFCKKWHIGHHPLKWRDKE